MTYSTLLPHFTIEHFIKFPREIAPSEVENLHANSPFVPNNSVLKPTTTPLHNY